MASYVEKKADLMHRLLWTNLLEEWVEKSLPLIPYVGPILAWSPLRPIIMWLIDHYLAEPLFLILTRWGVFTSIDWQNAAVYSAYEKEAEKLIPLQEKEVWDAEDRAAFRNSARALIRFNLRA